MFSKLDLHQIFEDFKRQKVLIIGDVMIDSYLWGKVNRISPEAPVPVVSDISKEMRLGGAANVALNIKAMGAIPILCSVVGDDDRGHIFLDLLSEQKLSDVGIVVEKGRITTQKTRVISGAQHLLRVDEETEDYISPRTERKLLEFISDMMEEKKMNTVVFQDYDKGVITPPIINEVTENARSQGIPVLVDPKKRNFLQFRGVDLFKPNFKELREGLKTDIQKTDLEAIAGMMEEFRKMNEFNHIMVTLSEMGVMINKDSDYHHIAAEIRDIADVSGAGDTVISLAALCMGLGMDPVDMAALSNLAGGQVCERTGVVSVVKEQLLKEAISIQIEEEAGSL